MEYYTIIKKNEQLTHTPMCISNKNILSDRNQTQEVHTI